MFGTRYKQGKGGNWAAQNLNLNLNNKNKNKNPPYRQPFSCFYLYFHLTFAFHLTFSKTFIV